MQGSTPHASRQGSVASDDGSTATPRALPCIDFEREPGAASRPLPGSYQRRTPETTALYAVVRDHLESFLDDARLRSATGAGYPPFVEQDFRRYLDCGILANGFARLRCPSCGFERLVAFSCKGRLCPSCQARRAADVAAHLVDRLLPDAPYRQWVLTFPWELRFLLAMDRTFLSEMLGGFQKTLFAWQRLRGRRAGLRDGRPGAVTFIQRFGSALNLNPHFHSLHPDGLFVEGAGERLSFAPLPPPTDEEVRYLATRLAVRLGALARRRLARAEDQPPWDSDEDASVLAAHADALHLPGPRLLPGLEAPEAGKPLCAKVDGFTLHAARRVEAADREGLERLCRYGLRSPISLGRLSLDPEGQVRYQLRRPWADGRTEVVLEPLAFLRRLAAIIPAPYLNLIRYHGVFANRSRDRFRLPLPPPTDPPAGLLPPTPGPIPDGETDAPDTDSHGPPDPNTPGSPPLRPRRLAWAQLLRRVLHIDALTCPACSASLTVLAFLTDPPVLKRILDHLGLPSSPPRPAPARSPLDEAWLFPPVDAGELDDDWPGPEPDDEQARAPP